VWLSGRVAGEPCRSAGSESARPTETRAHAGKSERGRLTHSPNKRIYMYFDSGKIVLGSYEADSSSLRRIWVP
jgi:hypothetical protein